MAKKTKSVAKSKRRHYHKLFKKAGVVGKERKYIKNSRRHELKVARDPKHPSLSGGARNERIKKSGKAAQGSGG